jgi:hypothetical protein
VLAASIITAIIAMMMKAVSTSQTSVNFYQTTQRNIPKIVIASLSKIYLFNHRYAQMLLLCSSDNNDNDMEKH